MKSIKNKQKTLSEDFLTGVVPTYLSPINPRKKVENGVFQMTADPSIQETEYLRANFLISSLNWSIIRITFNDVWISNFDEVTGYMGLDAENGDYWRFQFSDSGATVQAIRVYAYKNSSSLSFDAGSAPIGKDKPLDLGIEYNIEGGYMDFFVEGSRYRINDANFLPSAPLYLYMYVRTRDSKAKTLGIGGFKIELE